MNLAIAGEREMVERGVPVEDDVGRHALAPQPSHDRRGQILGIFSYQHSHDLPDPSAASAPSGSGRGYVPWARQCQVTGISTVSAADTGLIPALAYNRLRTDTSTSQKAAR